MTSITTSEQAEAALQEAEADPDTERSQELVAAVKAFVKEQLYVADWQDRRHWQRVLQRCDHITGSSLRSLLSPREES